VVLVLGVGLTHAVCPLGDIDGDCDVDALDLRAFAAHWLDADCVSPDCRADLDGRADVNAPDFALFSGHWLTDHNLPAQITWFAHASFKVVWSDTTIYIDPRNLSIVPHDADIILVSHSHGDHYHPASIANVSNAQTTLVASTDVIASQGYGIAMIPNQSLRLGQVVIYTIPSYNLIKTNHPRSKNWLGYIIDAGPLRIYYAGDTDRIPEMAQLTAIDVAILPVGGTYTMNAAEAAAATGDFLPGLGIPAHWGTSVGTLADAQLFQAQAHCPVVIMSHGQTISTDKPFGDPPPDR